LMDSDNTKTLCAGRGRHRGWVVGVSLVS
jgi:hypothetical protein